MYGRYYKSRSLRFQVAIKAAGVSKALDVTAECIATVSCHVNKWYAGSTHYICIVLHAFLSEERFYK